MRILLIGGNGFIGAPLVRNLRASGHKLGVFHRGANSYPDAADVVHIQGDRNRLTDYRGQLQEFSPEVVIDLILSSGDQARQLMETLRHVAPRVVAVSSMDVYRAWGVLRETEPGGLEPLPLTENAPLRTMRTVYPPETLKMLRGVFTWVNDQYDKIAVEEAIMDDRMIPGSIVRLPMVYGPGDPLHRFFPLLKRIADGRTSILFPDDLAAWRCPRGFVENIAHAIALAATSNQAAGRVYNVCDEPTLEELEWQKKIANQLHWQGKFVVLPRERTPEHLLQEGNTAQHVVVSSQRIRTELHYTETVAMDEAILRTAAWEQQNPPGTANPKLFDYDAEDAALASLA